MKNKSLKEKKRNSFNESSSTFVEPSFSKITFRKKGHDEGLEMSDIGEEEDIRSNKLDFDLPENLNQSNWSGNNPEYPKVKKRRKRRKDINHELIVSKEGCTDVNGDEVKSLVELGEEFESPELNCSTTNSYVLNLHKKKKKKKCKMDKNALKITSNLTKKFSTDIITDEQPVVDLGVGFESNELNNSVSSSDSPNVFNKKKKRKNISDDSLHKLNSNKEGFNDVKLDEDKVEGALRTGSPVKKSKTKHNKLKLADEEAEVCVLINSPQSKENSSTKKQKDNRLEIVSDDHLKNISKEEFLEHFEMFPNSPSKEYKRKHSQSGENVIGISDSIDSPLLKKKKKTQKLMDESCLNTAGKEQIHKEGSGSENNLVVDNNDLINPILHNKDTFNFTLHSKKKRESRKLLDASNLSMLNNDQFQNDRRDTDNNEVFNDLNVAQAVQAAKKLKPSLKKKKKIKNNIESLRNRLLKEALSGTQESEDLRPKSSKLKMGVEENVNIICLLKETINGTKEAENLPQISKKLKTGIEENVAPLRKCLLKEVGGGKEAEDLPQKSSKLKTEVQENVDTLRKRLLKEAICDTKGAKVLTLKSRKQMTGVKENIETLTECLLKEAISSKKGAEDLPPKRGKIKTIVTKSSKACLPNEDQKGKSKSHKNLKGKLQNKEKHKIKHKYKSNDIDLLTDILISKALEKVSSSSPSHSSQENIDSLNVEAKEGVDLKKYGTSENKIVKVKKLKSNLSEQRSIKLQDQDKQHKSEIEKMQKVLLNNAIKNINPGFESLKDKLKKKAFSSSEKCISKSISKRGKEKTGKM